MSSADDLTESLRRISLGDTGHGQPRPQTSSPPKSFLQHMNEKLAQRPQKQRSRKRGSFGNSHLKKPLDPSQFYIVENNVELLGVYSTTDAATRAARLAGALEYYLARWVDEGIRDCGNKVRILPQKLQCTKVPADSKENGKPDNEGPRSTASEENDSKESSKDTKTENSQSATPDPVAPLPSSKDMPSVYVALDRSLCLGLFAEKSRAWEACMEHKTQITYSVELRNGKQWVDKDGMPFLQGTIAGGGMHCWFVKLCVVDEMPKERGRRRRAP